MDVDMLRDDRTGFEGHQTAPSPGRVKLLHDLQDRRASAKPFRWGHGARPLIVQRAAGTDEGDRDVAVEFLWMRHPGLPREGLDFARKSLAAKADRQL